ncbi:MAG: class I SAM-dependent methyltransferase [Candidatus Altiarchaeota archaeon]
MDDFMRDHWEGVYGSYELDQLGWYEETPTQSLNLVSRCGLRREDAILDVGCGTSTFIDHLIQLGYTNLIAADISQAALEKLRKRLGPAKASHVRWIVDDISQPAQIQELHDIALWHDRAVLHFLLEEKRIETYFTTLKKVVRRGGYVIIAAFSLEGAKKCSGLDVRNYDQNMLSERLGNEFKLLQSFNHTHHTPSGKPRPYVYTLFQRR